MDRARAVRGALRGWGGIHAGAGGIGTLVPGAWWAEVGDPPGAAGADLAGAVARPGQYRRPGDVTAPYYRSNTGTHAAGVGRGPGAADGPAAAGAGARRPALERPFHPGSDRSTGATPGTGTPAHPRHISTARG